MSPSEGSNSEELTPKVGPVYDPNEEYFAFSVVKFEVAMSKLARTLRSVFHRKTVTAHKLPNSH